MNNILTKLSSIHENYVNELNNTIYVKALTDRCVCAKNKYIVYMMENKTQKKGLKIGNINLSECFPSYYLSKFTFVSV